MNEAKPTCGWNEAAPLSLIRLLHHNERFSSKEQIYVGREMTFGRKKALVIAIDGDVATVLVQTENEAKP